MANRTERALSLFQDGKLSESLSILDEELKTDERNAFFWFLSAIIHLQLNNVIDSIVGFRKAIDIQPIYPEALNNLGVALEADGSASEAANFYRIAIQQKSNYANAYYNLANIEKEEGKLNSAIEHYQLAIKYNSKYCNAMNNLALIYQNKGEYNKSEKLLERSLGINGNDISTKNNFGFNFYCKHKYDKSGAIYENILESNPDFEPTLLNMGQLLQSKQDFKKAKDFFLKIPSQSSHHIQAMSNLSHLELLIGNYESGWKFYKNRPSVRKLPFTHMEYLPSDLKKCKILLYKDQGIGDEIFFSRYLLNVLDTGANVSYYTDEKLINIFTRTFQQITFYSKKPNIEDFDYILSVGDLPRLFYQNQSPPKSTQFSTLGDAVKKMMNMLPNNNKENIAVTWRAGVTGRNTLYKHIPPDILGRHLSQSSANIIVIQRNLNKKEVKLFEQHLKRKAFIFSFANDNLDEMLALLSIVDNYICVSNTNNHLRSALNLPSEVLVPYPPEWRWTISSERSPWFPNCHIHRQDMNGKWDKLSLKLNKI